MTGRAACRGAATIVNAIPTGLGAAFGITLETDAEVNLTEATGFSYQGAPEGADLVEGCVNSVLERAGISREGVSVRIESDIPLSRGLKSSSAVSNAVVLATARATGIELRDDEVLALAIAESLRAGVTVTGAFDDAAACLLGGAVVTDNQQRKILWRGNLDDSLSVVVHVPERRIEKGAVKTLDFSPARAEAKEAIRLALAGEFGKAMEVNSKACAKVLGLSEEVAEFARAKGALAAGISGTGPATVALTRVDLAKDLVRSLECEFEGDVLVARVNKTPAKEVVPRLL